jgi:hypothetical protein
MQYILSQHDTNVNSLPRDFAEFLSELPRGFTFNLWNVQGALRFTRQGVPNEQSYEHELETAQQLGLIEPAGEDLKWTEREWSNGYPRELRAGIQFKRTARPALAALSTSDLKLLIAQRESELADAVAELNDFAEAYHGAAYAEGYRLCLNELRKPVRELRAQVRKVRALLYVKEAPAQN